MSADSLAVVTGEITNLENINLIEHSAILLFNGGSYTGNITAAEEDVGLLFVGAFFYGLDEAAYTYDAAGTVDGVALYVGGTATFNTNGHEFGSDISLAALYVGEDSVFNMQDDVTLGQIIVDEAVVRESEGVVLEYGTLKIGASARLSTNLFNSDSGTLIFDVASPTQAGFLDVTGEALDLTGVTVEGNFTGDDSLFTHGNQVKVAQGDGTLIGTDGNLGQASTQITENSALFNIFMMDGSKLQNAEGDNELYFVFRQEATIRETAKNNNNKNVGGVLDNLSGTSNTQLSQIITKVNAASQSKLESVLESTTPDVGGGIAAGSQNFVNNTLEITSEQITIAMNNSQTGVASGDEMRGLRMWGQYFVQDAKQGVRENIAGYDSSTNGLAFGFDTTDLIEDTVFGLGFSYGDTHVDSNNASNSRNVIDSYQFTGYGSYQFPADYFIKGMVAYAHNEVQTTRHNVGDLGLNARGNYNANIYTVRTDMGKDFKKGSMRFTPSLLGHYSLYNAEDYREEGAGGANLNVRSKSMEILEFGANLELGWDVKLGKESSISPEIRAGYRYNVIADKFITNSNFVGGGTSFETIGARPARGTMSVGGGVVYQVTSQWDVSLNYEYEHRQNFNSNSGFARISYKF